MWHWFIQLKSKNCISGHGNCLFPDLVPEVWCTGTGLTGLRQEGKRGKGRDATDPLCPTGLTWKLTYLIVITDCCVCLRSGFVHVYGYARNVLTLYSCAQFKMCRGMRTSLVSRMSLFFWVRMYGLCRSWTNSLWLGRRYFVAIAVDFEDHQTYVLLFGVF